MTHKIVKSEEFSACLKETQSNDTLKSTYYVKYDINNENYANDASYITSEMQPTQNQKITKNGSDNSDGFKSNSETKIKLKSIEKVFEELEIKNKFMTDQVLSNIDRNKVNNDQNIMIKTELNKIKTDIDKLCNRKISKEMENFQNFQILITTITQIDNQMGQFMLEMKNLKTLVEGACENKHIMKEIMKLLDYMKEQHCIQISKNQKYFDEQTSKYKYKIEELKAYASSKDKEVETLEERVTHQENHINYCEDYITRVNEFITDKLTILIPYITKLEVTVENQKKIISLVAEKLEDMDKIETEYIKDMIKSLDNECLIEDPKIC